MSVSADTESEQEYLNQPNIKFQPHGHLTLAAEQDMEKLVNDHEMQKVLPRELHFMGECTQNFLAPWLKI